MVPEVVKLDPEQHLLLYCARRHLSTETESRIRASIAAGVDWNRFVTLAAQHQVTPLVQANLKKSAAGNVPTAVSLLLAKHCDRYNNYYWELLRELLKILALLKDNGIPVIPFKGPTLALRLYGDLKLRPFGDLDILIHLQDLDRSLELLSPLGYHYRSSRSSRKERHFRKNTGQIHLVNDRSSVHLEPHWSLAQYVFALDVDYQTLWCRAQQEQLFGHSVTLMHPVDEILMLSIHGFREQWHKLKWLCDISEFLHHNQALDWHAVLASSRAIGAERVLTSALLLANRLLDAPLPQHFLAPFDRATETVVKLASQRIMRDDIKGPDLWRLNRFYFYGRERWRDRLRYLCRLHLVPRLRLVEAYNLPDVLFFLYYPMSWIHDYLLLPLRNLVRGGGRY